MQLNKLFQIIFLIQGAATGSLVSGYLVSNYGLPLTFKVWSIVAGISFVLHLLWQQFLAKRKSELILRATHATH